MGLVGSARPFCAVGAVGREMFPPFGVKPDIKAKQFSFNFLTPARQIFLKRN